MYDNECLWDQFSLSISPSSRQMLTGSYHSTFNILDVEGRSNVQLELSFSKKTTGREVLGNKVEPITEFEYKFKTLKSIYHPVQDLVAVTCLNSLFFYCKKKAI
jgi:serine/threonine-protein phosphatase 2A regulatory subunit B